ncbi:3-oxoacyl-(acyl carrier protein) reductase [Paramyrothecium foliicola]|nr:3-oxoacyl-(acyl carrier protein) reductase [Paramyrothecium foliicola]
MPTPPPCVIFNERVAVKTVRNSLLCNQKSMQFIGPRILKSWGAIPIPHTTFNAGNLGIASGSGLGTRPVGLRLSSFFYFKKPDHGENLPNMSDRVAQIANHLNYPKGLLAGQVAIITGSGQGIGAETARLFANEGAKVVVADIDAKKSASVAEAINSSGGKAIAVPGDILKPEYVDELVAKAAEFGGGKIHIIVNNAGYTWDGVIHKMTDAQWDAMLALHCTAPFRLLRAASPYFRVRDGEPRCVVSISSTSGVHGNAGQLNYALAKAGITGFTKTVAKEWGPAFGVRANTVAFGHILTRLTAAKEEGGFVTGPDGEKIALGIPQKQKDAAVAAAGGQAHADIPLRRAGTATEAASSILAVASPLFSYVTGQTIMVTGGRNILHLQPQREDTLGVADNLVAAQLGLAVQAVDEGDGHLGDGEAHGLGTDHQLHLEAVALALGAGNGLLQDALLVEAEAARQVADAGAEDGVGEQVGAAADELALEVPAEDAAVAGVAGARDDVVVGRLLQGDHLGDELGVVAEVGVHDDDEVARDELQAVDVGGAEAQLAGARLEDDVRGVGLDELLGDLLGAVGGAVVDDDDFPVKVAARKKERPGGGSWRRNEVRAWRCEKERVPVGVSRVGCSSLAFVASSVSLISRDVVAFRDNRDR